MKETDDKENRSTKATTQRKNVGQKGFIQSFVPNDGQTGQNRNGIRNSPGGGDARTPGGQVDRGQSSRKRPTVDCCNTAIFSVIIINNNNVNCDRNTGHNNSTMYNTGCY